MELENREEREEYVGQDFSWALGQIKEGEKVSRLGWNGPGMYIYRVKMALPYPTLPDDERWKEGVFSVTEFLVIKTTDDKLMPWLASQADILSEDWVLVR